MGQVGPGRRHRWWAAGRKGNGETVPVARNRCDRLMPQDLAEGRHLHLQVVFFDHQVWPNHGKQFALWNHTIPSLDQREKDIERARAQRHGFSVNKQLPSGRAQLEATKLVGSSHGRWGTPFQAQTP